MYGQKILHEFSNVGFSSALRQFPGLVANAAGRPRQLALREALRLDLRTGDLLSISATDDAGPCVLLIFDGKGQAVPDLLGLTATSTLSASDFDSRALLGWIGANGGTGGDFAAAEVGSDEMVVLKAAADCTVWAVRPLRADSLVTGDIAGAVEVTLKRARLNDLDLLPPPLGDIREEITVTRGTGMAYELAPGEIVQIIDVEGQQCSDFMAFRADGLERSQELLIDSTATRTMVRRAYPGPGLFDKFFDQDLNPLLQVVQDTCGRHDTFGAACTARGYEDRGFPGHVNCSDNISNAMAPFGAKSRAAWPAINFFWNTWIDAASHHILTEESHSRPGDYVAMRAMDRLVCVSTACPDDLDPINGWNPTDVHVRIYRPDAPIRRAVAYRAKEDDPMTISQESVFHDRTSRLTSHFAPVRDVWVPTSFPETGSTGEYWACREKVTVQDMSGLRKFDIIGPDAERLLQRAMTRNVARLAVWRGTYALMCDEAGAVIDDGTLFRVGPELFRWCCANEECGRVLEALAKAEGWQVRIHALEGALPNLALQGPRSRDLLRKIVFTQPHVPSLDQMKWFGVTVARLNDRDGAPFMLSRSGYTGELGYEIFCAQSGALPIWDAIMEAGAEFGITPMGNDALSTIRIEAGLAAGGAEFAPGVDAFEAGLGFAVDLKKPEFTGRAALERNARDQRRVLKGLVFQGDDVPLHGAPVMQGERPVGVITSATRSPMQERAIAMARLSVEFCENGTVLEVGQMDGRMKRLTATVCNTPFYDPKRERARA